MAKEKTALIYEKIVAVSSTRHARTFVEVGKDFRFSAGLDAVPILAEEFPSIARICPIVFAGPDEAPIPHAMLSLKRGTNAFVGPNGGWAAPYIPAFLRRYPFISAVGKTRKDQPPVLSVDQAFKGLNERGRGYAMFDKDGNPTKFLSDVNKFVVSFDRSFAQTQAFVDRLMQHDLLDAMAVRITDKDGVPSGGIGGMFGVVQTRLDGLDEAVRAELDAAGDLKNCSLHLKSLAHLQRKAAANTAPVRPKPH